MERWHHRREQPHLLTLPTSDFDTAQVAYRHVNVEGYVSHRLNFYSVPWLYIGQVLPVRITESEVIVYSIRLEEIARHSLVPSTQTAVRQQSKSHHPTDDPGQRERLLRERFSELGPLERFVRSTGEKRQPRTQIQGLDDVRR